MSKHIPIIDLHCHPTMKPFGLGFKDGQPGQVKTKRTNIWYRDKPDVFEKLANYIIGLTKWTQTDMTSLATGNVTVVCAALYAPEKKFVRNKMGTGTASDLGVDLLTGLGKARIDRLQEMPDYFTDLQQEHAFLKLGENDGKPVNGRSWTYRIVRNYSEIESIQRDRPDTVCVIPTIEGAHVFNSGLQTMGRPDASCMKRRSWPTSRS